MTTRPIDAHLQTEWELRLYPRYRRNLDRLLEQRLALWGHRTELRIRGHLIRRGTYTTASRTDWHVQRYLGYLAERDRRARRLRRALVQINATFEQFARDLARAARAFGQLGAAYRTPAA